MTLNHRALILAASLAVLCALVALTPTVSGGRPQASKPPAVYRGIVIDRPFVDIDEGEILQAVRFQTMDAAGAQSAAATRPPKLLGITLIGRARWAYFASAQVPYVRARVGQEIDGWRITAIGPSAVALEGGGEPVVLRPFSVPELESASGR